MKGLKVYTLMKENKENKQMIAEEVAAALNATPDLKHRNYTAAELEIIIDMIGSQIVEIVKDGKEAFFTGFGSFKLQKHKGHPVQFKSNDTEIKDYVTLKFSASSNMNSRLREEFQNGKAIAFEKKSKKTK